MSKVSRKKEKYGVFNEHPGDNANEGTAARTRPFSFKEIMLRRKTKKMKVENAGDLGNLSVKDTVESFTNSSEHDEVYRGKKNSVIVVTKHDLGGNVEGRSRKKEEIITLKEDNSIKGKDKETRDSEANLKNILDKDISITAKEGNRGEKQSHHRGRNEEHLISVFENEYKKRLDKTAGKDKYQDIEREEPEIQTKRKHRSRDRDEKRNRLEKDENAAKKHNSGKRYISEPAEKKDRKKVTSPSNYEDARPKRRRSRSREARDRDKRSVSLSPRLHKHIYHGLEHGNSSSHSSKERRQYSDVDRKRMTSNGGYGNSHHRHHGVHGSRLGGYSPRKRRSEAAARTPSPTIRSPERKSAGWDLPPAGTGIISSVSMTSSFQSSLQITSSTAHESSGIAPVLPNIQKPSGISPHTLSKTKDVSIDSIQLTQATRPMRRLYVENLPISASDKSVMECFNNFLLSSGANHIQGTQPCISCIANKEKGQAVLEFLTPEDATAALSFDGRSFSGSVLKVRRPKDFVETATGVLEKSVVVIDAISDIVKDTPHKIFIGGISKLLSSDMLMEIVSSFGPLKAYRFQVNEDLNEPVAFLEYADVSNTNKACAGLNGMKIGGQVLTVVLAVRGVSHEENTHRPPFFGIPEHAKPLLSKPTKVLKLKNVFNEVELSSLSGPELEETLEDIRLECTRFGTVKSVNVIRDYSSVAVAPESYEAGDQTDLSVFQDQEGENIKSVEATEEHIDTYCGDSSEPNGSENDTEPLEHCKENDFNIDEPDHNLVKDGVHELSQLDSDFAPEVTTNQLDSNSNPQESSFTQLDAPKDQFTGPAHLCETDSNMKNSLVVEEELELREADGALQEASAHLNAAVEKESNFSEKGKSTQQVNDNNDVFEQGCILIEYARIEAACMAAHCLHGRLYGDKTVEVSYVSHDVYLSRFQR